MRYIPKTNYERFDDPTVHTLKVKLRATTVFDENYKFVDNSFKAKVGRFVLKAALAVIGWPIMWTVTGFKIKGMRNLRRNRRLLKRGFMTACNHIHLWDFVGIILAFFRYAPNMPAWDQNVLGTNRHMVRMTGGIPVPKTPRALKAFSNAIEGLLKDEKWVHFYPEVAMWDYYHEIRPFKKAAFAFAAKADVPMLPLVYTYRKPRGIWKLFRKPATLTLNIGEPVFPDIMLEMQDRAADLLRRTRSSILKMAEINEDVFAARQEALLRNK